MTQVSRLLRRLFCFGAICLWLAAAWAQSPTLTTVSEVRWTDAGWGPNNDQNLAGRFMTREFTLPRLGKTQDYYLRQYDGSNPPRYSRCSAALHIDYPF